MALVHLLLMHTAILCEVCICDSLLFNRHIIKQFTNLYMHITNEIIQKELSD